MKIFAAAVCFGILFGSIEAFSLRQLLGTCVEECSLVDTDVEPCPDGLVCRSNGCGHTCQKPLALGLCPIRLLCLTVYCPWGYTVDVNGCRTCQCQALLESAKVKV